MTDVKSRSIFEAMEQLGDTKDMSLQTIASAAGPVGMTITMPFIYSFALESVPRGKLSKHALARRLLEDAIRRMIENQEIPASEDEPAIPFDEAK